MWYKDRGFEAFLNRVKFVKVVFLVFWVFLFLRTFQIQVLRGFKFQKKSEGNYLKKFIIPPSRGIIFSKDNKIVAGTYISYNLVSQSRPDEQNLKKLLKILKRPARELRRNILMSLARGEVLITVAKDLKGKELIPVAARLDEFEGMRIVKAPKRFYPFGKIFSHITGYLGPLPKEKKLPYSYKGALHGISGIEKTCDRYLFGIPGGEVVEVNSRGKVISVKGSLKPRTGSNVYLTIYSNLQKIAFEAFEGRKGCAIALNPQTGEIYLMVSSPGFNPELFLEGKVKDLITSREYPLINRCIQMKYPPGSTFKIVTSACALNENLIDLNEKFFCNGVFHYGNKDFACWKEKGHGDVDFFKGFSQSCNVYFYNLGLKAGGKKLAEYAKKMGLSLTVFKDIEGELSATIPSPSWKKKEKKYPWLPGDSINMAIGQGYLWVTPIEMALLVSGVANNGVIMRPYLIEKIVSSEGKLEYQAIPKVVKEYSLNPRTFSILKEAMRKVVLSGTGQILNIPDVIIYGKTGTAQNPNGEDHGWFVSFGGEEFSQFSLVVVVEHGGMGSTSAGPISRKIWQKYIKLKKSDMETRKKEDRG
ncbi:MAG: penicillin-binding protein 2 [Elusimicrobia bacterium]|nr:penicillin-binding protein 2 [Elusimicrobiota bacterium]